MFVGLNGSATAALRGRIELAEPHSSRCLCSSLECLSYAYTQDLRYLSSHANDRIDRRLMHAPLCRENRLPAVIEEEARETGGGLRSPAMGQDQHWKVPIPVSSASVHRGA